LDKREFHGRDALLREKDQGGPPRRLVGLEWSSEDMAELHAAQYRDGASAPPPDLPAGQFRVFYLKVPEGGWASGYAYSPTLRRMISLARLDREIAAGTKVQVEWGGFSDEPTMAIGARVVELPFIRRTREQVIG
jgi:glycine cleavage system aminomethyltransferase T